MTKTLLANVCKHCHEMQNSLPTYSNENVTHAFRWRKPHGNHWRLRPAWPSWRNQWFVQLKSFLLLIQKLTTRFVWGGGSSWAVRTIELTTRPRVTISLQAFRHITFIVPLASDKTCAQKEKMIELMTGKVEAPWSTLLVEMRPDQSWRSPNPPDTHLTLTVHQVACCWWVSSPTSLLHILVYIERE